LQELEDARKALDGVQADNKSRLEAVRANHEKELEEAAEARVRIEIELKKEIAEARQAAEKQLAGLRQELNGAKAEIVPSPEHVVASLKEELRRTAQQLEEAYAQKDEEMQALHLAATKKLSDVEAQHRKDLEGLQQLNMDLQVRLANQ
jgi:hypothetical protein